MKKTGYTFDQHESLGLELQTMRDRLVTIQTELGKAYPIKTAAKTESAWKAVDALRNALDDIVCREHPENKAAGRVYYRSNRPDYTRPDGN